MSTLFFKKHQNCLTSKTRKGHLACLWQVPERASSFNVSTTVLETPLLCCKSSHEINSALFPSLDNALRTVSLLLAFTEQNGRRILPNVHQELI